MGVFDAIVTVSDRFVAAVSPVAGARRAAARASLGVVNSIGSWQQPPNPGAGYGRHGASTSKRSLAGMFTRQGNADEDVVKHLDGDRGLRSRSRDLWMSVATARGAIRTRGINAIGAGLRLSPQIDADVLGISEDEADAWERDVERRFCVWADSPNCDAARQLPFGGMQALAYLSAAISGDVFVVMPLVPRPGTVGDLRVQLIEADRVCDPWPLPADADIVGGVEAGPYGEPLAYHFAPAHPGAADPERLRLLWGGKWTRVLAYGERTGRRQVLHLMPHERPEQRRGAPLLSPVVESLKQLGRYTNAELDAAVLTAMLTVFITSERPDNKGTLGIMAKGEDGTGTDGDGTPPAPADPTGESIELGSGNVVELLPGEHVDTVHPQRPNAQFDGFVRAISMQIGAAIGVPYEVLVQHFTTSYTASRAALLQFWKGVMVDRTWFAGGFCQPVYEEWLTGEIAEGRIAAPGFFADPLVRSAWCAAEWNGPAQGQIQERVEVAAAYDRVRTGFATMEAETAQLTGRSWHRTNRQRARELQKQRAAGTAGPYESAPSQPGAAQGA